MKFKGLVAGAAAGVLVSVAMGGVAGAVVISNGVTSVGVGAYGELFDAGVGLQRGGVDVLATAYSRDSWGVNGDFADTAFGGLSGITAGAFTSTANSAVASFTTDSGFAVTQTFSFVADNILAIDIDLTNISGGDLTALFQRLADFQVDQSGDAPVEFTSNPYSTGIQTTESGYEDPSTANEWFFGCCSADPFDAGAGFRLDLGTIAAGGSRSFTFYYGIGDADVADQLKSVGATDVLTVANRDGSLAGGLGVAVQAPVPEPATWAMMILGFFGLGSVVRRRRAALA